MGVKLTENSAMVAVWVVAGAAYVLYVAATGEKGVPGVVGLLLFALAVAASPWISDALSGAAEG